jgi:hypothetical protein
MKIANVEEIAEGVKASPVAVLKSGQFCIA